MTLRLPPLTVPRASVEVWRGYTMCRAMAALSRPPDPFYAPHWLHRRAVGEGTWDPAVWACAGVWDEGRGGAFCPDEPRPLTFTAPDPCDFRPALLP